MAKNKTLDSLILQRVAKNIQNKIIKSDTLSSSHFYGVWFMFQEIFKRGFLIFIWSTHAWEMFVSQKYVLSLVNLNDEQEGIVIHKGEGDD